MRASWGVLVLVLGGCQAPAWSDGAALTKLQSRRFVIVTDVDADVLALAAPHIDRADEGQAARWDMPRDARGALVLFADEEAYKAWREARRDDSVRWGCGDGFLLGDDLAVRVRRRDTDDLGVVLFGQARRDREAAHLVGAVAHQLAHARLRARGKREHDALPGWLREGTAELERLRAQAALDRGLDDPYQPGESAVDRALASLRLGALSLVRGGAPSPASREGAPIPDDAASISIPGTATWSWRSTWLGSVPWSGQPDLDLALVISARDEEARRERRSRSTGLPDPSIPAAGRADVEDPFAPPGATLERDRTSVPAARATTRARLIAAEALAALVLFHPSGAFRGASEPALRLVRALLERPDLTEADAPAVLRELRARHDEGDVGPRSPSRVDPAVLRPELDAVLREVRRTEKQRQRWLAILDAP